MLKTEKIENIELNEGSNDLVTYDQLYDRLNDYLSEPLLNIGTGGYCYEEIVRNHLEIEHAKIVLRNNLESKEKKKLIFF